MGRKQALRIDIVTIFPEYFESPLRVSLIGKAAARGDLEFGVHDLRSWATDVLHHGQDLLVVRRAADQGEEYLIPFVKAIVPEVDVAAGVLVIDPPPGLLDPAQAQ